MYFTRQKVQRDMINFYYVRTLPSDVSSSGPALSRRPGSPAARHRYARMASTLFWLVDVSTMESIRHASEL